MSRRWKVRGLVRLHMHHADESVEGVCVARADGHYRLLSAKVLTADGASTPLAGETAVPAASVKFVQLLDR